jgi:linoleoyl-CoA desaturase
MTKNTPAVRFIRPTRDSFRTVLTKRVREYFKEKNISNKANGAMVLKTIGMLLIYFVPYTLVLTTDIGVLGVNGMYFLMGIGMSGIGMGVMHDAIHGAYHSNKTVNQILGSTIYFISGNVSTWRIQHNVLHHTYTNIEGLDEDMEAGGLIRMHESQEWKPMHKYQKWYAPLVYGLLTLNWVVAKDFKQLIKYYKREEAAASLKKIRNEWIILVLTKMMYFSLFIVLPIILSPAAWYWIMLGFVLMHFTAGVVLSYVFQLAHMVEGVENMDTPENGLVEEEWMEHQLRTTADFARNNKLVNWFVGGLNFQVEHHLFPNICHIHYPAIAEIVRKTAAEFEIPYREYQKVSDALKAHTDYLLRMGQKPALA